MKNSLSEPAALLFSLSPSDGERAGVRGSSAFRFFSLSPSHGERVGVRGACSFLSNLFSLSPFNEKSVGVRGSSAFSLIEVMCATLILGVALVGLTQAITTALGSSKESELQTAAALLAAGRIETLRAEGYFYDGVEEGQCGNDLGQYQWRQTITSTAITGLHDVQVVIESSRTGKSIYELETLLFDASDFEDTSTQKTPEKSKKREGRQG